MFQQPINFSYQRTPLQALGWYLFFFLIGVVVFGAIGAFAAANFAEGVKLGQKLAIVYVAVLSILLLWKRQKDAANILLALCAVAVSIPFGYLAGLIPLAGMTTRPVAIESDNTVVSDLGR